MDFFFFSSKAFSQIIFCTFLEHSIIKLQTKRIKLNLLLKHYYLNSNFALTLGYLNPALNNLTQINHYPVDIYQGNQLLHYPVDRDLSSGQCYPPFEQLGPVLKLTLKCCTNTSSKKPIFNNFQCNFCPIFCKFNTNPKLSTSRFMIYFQKSKVSFSFR